MSTDVISDGQSDEAVDSSYYTFESSGSRESSEFDFLTEGSQNKLVGINSPGIPLPAISVASSGSFATPQSDICHDTMLKTISAYQTNQSNLTQPKLPVNFEHSSSFHQVRRSGVLSKVVKKIKSVTENVLTTMDPQMKEFIHSGGNIEVVVACDEENNVVPVREAFQDVFGSATVYGKYSKITSLAEQPVGFVSGKQAALERVSTLRRSGSLNPEAVVVAVEDFLYEVHEDLWINLSCLILSDPLHKIQLQTFSQPTPVDTKYIQLVRDRTPDNYDRVWSGYAVPVGKIIGADLNVPHNNWQKAVTGVNKSKLVYFAAKAIAGLYKKSLQVWIEDI